VPGRAAYVDGRGGSSMRLNFSGVGVDDIREGLKRLGEIVREQVELYGTLTGTASMPTPRRDPVRADPVRADPVRADPVRADPPPRAADEPANVLQLRRRRA
jgi:hypothetical protein